jgi:DNA-binding transcriptional ArsR family regulator
VPTSKAEAAKRFAALGDPQRLALVDALADGAEQSISALGAAATISRQALTKHLRVLEQVGLVRATRYGREVRFRIERTAIDESAHFLALVAGQWDDALARLKEQVER